MEQASLKLNIVTWNILADAYAGHSNNIAAPDYIRWHVRKEIIRSLLIQCKPDILCLQECDHFEDFYRQVIHDMGLSSLYVPRPERTDGILVAFNPELFTIAHNETVYFDVLEDILRTGSSAFKIKKRFVRNNIAVMVKLTLNKSPETSIVVSCGHLHWSK
jgi:mRNA deadenylase 3'-5' endonuclease subunit Ccr4